MPTLITCTPSKISRVLSRDDGFGEEEESEVTVEENGSRLEVPPRAVQDVVSKIGNAKVGLELLKKGRLALAKVDQIT